MRILIQRVRRASVTIGEQTHCAIGNGLLVLVGIEEADNDEDIAWLTGKLTKLRIFADESGAMNRSAEETGADILIVSQFTLYADCRKGNRPSFTGAGAPDHANRLYEYFMEQCKKHVEKVAHGEFGADMKVDLLNDGPFTLMLDSKELFPK